jgi:hypothetical protein
MIIKAKYPSKCNSCAQDINKGEDINYDEIDKSTRHIVCPTFCNECGEQIKSDDGVGNYHLMHCSKWKSKYS